MTHKWTLKRSSVTLLILVAQGTAIKMIEVSVCQDATFQIPASRGVVCSGNSQQPHGVECPRIGDAASDDCYSYLYSYNGRSCVAKEDALCVYLKGRNAWGCTFQSTRCNDKWETFKDIAVHRKCPTWLYSSQDAPSTGKRDPLDDENYANTMWFIKTTALRELDNCKGGTSKQSTVAPITTSQILINSITVPRVETLPAANKLVRSDMYTFESANAKSTSEADHVTTSCAIDLTKEKGISMLSLIPPKTDVSKFSLTGELKNQMDSSTSSAKVFQQTRSPKVKTIDEPITLASENAINSSQKYINKPQQSRLTAIIDTLSLLDSTKKKIATSLSLTIDKAEMSHELEASTITPPAETRFSIADSDFEDQLTASPAVIHDSMSSKSFSALSAKTPCASVTMDKQTKLQTSTKADFVTITSIGISAVAVAVIIIAIGSIVVLMISGFRTRYRLSQLPPEEHHRNHEIVLTPSEP
ncbi:hypothetical protein Plhal304r1_c001g0001841 [Plasmopara halstedii]